MYLAVHLNYNSYNGISGQYHHQISSYYDLRLITTTGYIRPKATILSSVLLVFFMDQPPLATGLRSMEDKRIKDKLSREHK